MRMRTLVVTEMDEDEENLLIAIKNYATLTGTSRKKVIRKITEDLEDIIDAKVAEQAYKEHLKNPEGAISFEELIKEMGI